MQLGSWSYTCTTTSAFPCGVNTIYCTTASIKQMLPILPASKMRIVVNCNKGTTLGELYFNPQGRKIIYVTSRDASALFWFPTHVLFIYLSHDPFREFFRAVLGRSYFIFRQVFLARFAQIASLKYLHHPQIPECITSRSSRHDEQLTLLS